MSEEESMSSGSEDSSEDEDEMLRRKFAKGELDGFARVQPLIEKKLENNVDGLKVGVDMCKVKLEWPERLDVTCDPVEWDPLLLDKFNGIDKNFSLPATRTKERKVLETELAQNDFQREAYIYRQAVGALQIGLPKLEKLGIPTERPDDYFAEMAKPDSHMNEVKNSLLKEKLLLEKKEKARKLREQKKFQKTVQHESLLEKSKEKKALKLAVKRHQAGKEKLNLDDGKKFKNRNPKTNQKNTRPDKREKFRGRNKDKGGKGKKQQRPGKQRRQNKKKH